MSTTTSNMNLTKPALTDTADITVIDNNMDTIDAHDHSSGKGVQIGSAGIADGAVTSSKFAAGAVTSTKIANGAVTTSQISATAGITGSQLANSTITSTQLADGAVTTTKITDANVTTAKIADANVTTAKIANNAVGTSQLATSPTITTPTISGHLTGSGGSPAFSAGSNNGTSPPAPAVTGGANDLAGGCLFGSGGSPSAGEQLKVTFANAYTGVNPPIPTVSPNNNATYDLGIWAKINGSSGNWPSLSIYSRNAPAAGQTNNTYSIFYHVIGA